MLTLSIYQAYILTFEYCFNVKPINPIFRVDTCQSIADETGQCIIPPYEHYDVIAGQVSLLCFDL